MRSASGKGAGHFTLATPMYAALSLSDVAFADAVACRLGLSAYRRSVVALAPQHHAPGASASAAAPTGTALSMWLLPVCRLCGEDMESNALHAFVCPKRRTNQQLANLSSRGLHNALAAAPGRPFEVPTAKSGPTPWQVDITKYADHLRLQPRTHRELLALPGFPREATPRPRGDIVIIHNGIYYTVLDFVVTSPLRDSYLQFTSFIDGYAAQEAEKGKDVHYRMYYKNLDAQPDAIRPCAVEIFGTLGERYHKFIRSVGDMAFPGALETDTDGLRSRFVDRIRQHVSVTQARIVHAVFESWRQDMGPLSR